MFISLQQVLQLWLSGNVNNCKWLLSCLNVLLIYRGGWWSRGTIMLWMKQSAMMLRCSSPTSCPHHGVVGAPRPRLSPRDTSQRDDCSRVYTQARASRPSPTQRDRLPSLPLTKFDFRSVNRSRAYGVFKHIAKNISACLQPWQLCANAGMMPNRN